MITYGNIGPLLREAGFYPIPCDPNTRQPLGPYMARQFPWHRNPAHNDQPVAVLTCLPPARNQHEDVHYSDTWLITARVSVRPDLLPPVEAVLKRYTGKSPCPVLVGDDGTLTYIFRPNLPTPSGIVPPDVQWSGPELNIRTDGNYTDYVHVAIEPSFLPVGSGSYRAGIDILTVSRNELPELTAAKADALVKEVNALLDKQATPIVALVRTPYVRKPLLEDVAQLRYGMNAEVRKLRANGYQPCPLAPKGKGVIRPKLTDAESENYQGYPDREEWKDCGVGLLTGWVKPNGSFSREYVRHGQSHIAEITVRTASADLMSAVDAVLTARLGFGPVRIGLDGQERLYLFRRDYGQPCEPVDFNRRAGQLGFPSIPGTHVTIAIAKADTIVISGYEWQRGSPLSIEHDALPRLDTSSANGLIHAVEGLLQSFTVVRKAS